MKLQLLSSDGDARYQITHKQEILRLLRGVMEARSTVAIYWDHHQDPALSSLVDVNPQRGELLLESGPSALAAERVLQSRQVVCVTSFEKVHIQFLGDFPSGVVHNGASCIRLGFPSELLRMQRRDYYRLTTSVIKPVKCLVNQDGKFVDTTVVDISVGGLGILSIADGVEIKAGDVYHGCRIALPNAGEYAISLQVCTTFELTLKNGKTSLRAGCQFIDLPPSVETEIQRYINRVDRERRSRYF
jgi:c-di-GMP-binding flagellar brake protein YcgR